VVLGVALGVALLGTGCGSAEPAADVPALVDAPSTSPIAHGNHDPAHGGLVLMHGDLHFEVVLDPGGRHRVYFSDAFRQELPAAVARDVTMTVVRPDAPPETLALRIDDTGESWMASGRAVAEPDASARVAFTFENAPYWIDLPFTKPAVDPNAPDPHATMPAARPPSP
jgi:hypothetical protein